MKKYQSICFRTILLKAFNNNWIMLSILLLSGCFLAIFTKFEFGWDFINYHYYNAYALLHNRMNYDIVPASINTFFNPLLDLPGYFIIEKFNDMPNIAYALQGIWFGLLLFGFFKFSCLFFDIKKENDVLAMVAVLLIAMTGQATFFQIGTSTNEIQIALFGFIGLYELFLMIKELDKQKKHLFFISGLILGAALGLKPTIIYICCSAGCSLIIFYKYLRKPVIFIALFTLGGLTGYLITNGWWMYKMWTLYESPFFPFANSIFHSPYFSEKNYNDVSLIPPLGIAIIYPLLWNFSEYRPTEQYFYDLHAPLFYILGIGGLIYLLFHTKARQNFLNNRLWCFYTVFLILSYILWINIFSIARYLIIIEMMSAIFLVKIIKKCSEKYMKCTQYICTVIIIFALIIFYNRPWVGRADNSKLIDVERIILPQNTLLKLYGLPLAGFIPQLAKDNDFRALGYSQLHNKDKNHTDFIEYSKFRQMRDKIEAEHEGPIVVIYRELLKESPNYTKFHNKLDKEIANMNCRELKHNFEQGELGAYICFQP